MLLLVNGKKNYVVMVCFLIALTYFEAQMNVISDEGTTKVGLAVNMEGFQCLV